MNRIAAPLRRHWLFFLVMPILIIVMTFPAFIYIFDASVFWLPSMRDDIYMLFWDSWHGAQVVAGKADFFHTDLKFYPQGVSLAYHNHSVPHMLLHGGLQAFLPPSNAFNLTYLTLVFITAAAGYVYLQYLLQDRWISLFGAVLFAASPFVMGRPATPHISFIAGLPLSLYLFHRGIDEKRLKLVILAGLCIGSSAFVGLYSLVCLLITVALYILVFARSRWNQRWFLAYIAVLAVIVAAVCSARVGPMIADARGFAEIITKNADSETGRDLLGYFVNYEHPITTPLLKSLFNTDTIESGWRQTVYIGFLPLALVIAGAVSARFRGRAYPWLALSLVFLVLRLGSTPNVNDVEFEAIRLPKYYLEQAIPVVFQPFWSTDQFFAGALFPLALAACYGMKALLQRVKPRRRAAVTLLAAGLIAFEYYQLPDELVITKSRFAHVEWLKAADEREPVRLINLPIDGPLSKRYDFFQSFSGIPHAEGRPTRTPPGAYAYIDSNVILKTWRSRRSVHCLPHNEAEFAPALDQLLADGFSHAVLHHWLWRAYEVAESFAGLRAAYEDEHVSIYRLEELRASCGDSLLLSVDGWLPLRQLALAPDIIPDSDVSIVSLHNSAGIDDGLFAYFASVFSDWKSLVHVYRSGGEIQFQSSDWRHADLDEIWAQNTMLLLAYAPSPADPGWTQTFNPLTSAPFHRCNRALDDAGVVFEYYIRGDFPCELIAAEKRLEVRYDNDLRLLNRLIDFDDGVLTVDLWWAAISAGAHSVSIQVFDSEGGKAAGQDFSVGVHALAKYQLDLSALAPGEYGIMLIVYNYETGKSVPGAIAESQSRFARALEIGRISAQ